MLTNYIDGELKASSASTTIESRNPTTGEVYSTLPAGCPEDIDAAVSSAKRAQPGWASMPVRERVTILLDIADRIEKDAEDLSRIEAEEMGKPLSVGGNFLKGGLKVFRDGVHEALDYKFSEEVKVEDGDRTSVVHKPVGVVAVIVPWNFTTTTVLQGIYSFLAAGNSVVVKPSEKSSAAAVRLFESVMRSALPSGVLNLVLGDGRAGGPLVKHPDVQMVHFTGSVKTGRSIAETAGAKLHRSVMELGGNDPVVIDRDVDVVSVAKDVAAGSFLNTGQICTSMERIYVHKDISDRFISALVDEANTFVCGDPLDLKTALGPLVDESQRSIVRRHLDDAVQKGAKVLFQGECPETPGTFFPPTVVGQVDESMDLMSEETFGPIAAVQFVDTFEEGLLKADSGRFGLAATVYSNSRANLDMAVNHLNVGILWLNRWQGGDLGRKVEPAKNSGMGAMGGCLSFDAATRPQAVHSPA